jgi:glycerol-3-phosphate acyltransferase PlsY
VLSFEQIVGYAVLAGFAYLVGSLPIALIVSAIFKRVDLRTTGSGNFTVYNTFFRVGKLPGLFVLLWNLVAVLVVLWFASLFFPSDTVALLTAITGVTVGSMWQVFARFRGSRGTTTLAFALVVAEPTLWAVCFATWILALLPRRRTTDATPVLHALLPIIFGVITGSWTYAVAGSLLGVLLQIKRRSSKDDTLSLGLFRRFGINVNR